MDTCLANAQVSANGLQRTLFGTIAQRCTPIWSELLSATPFSALFPDSKGSGNGASLENPSIFVETQAFSSGL
jgi:hypothetical protein